jgi:short-subunit dehydrogenase
VWYDLGMGSAIVTGASAGIGAVYARRLAERGHDLVLVARRQERIVALADELSAAHGIRAEPLVADLGDPGGVERVAKRAQAGDVSMLVNNAGINGYAPFHEVEPDIVGKVIALNVTAPVMLSRAALPGMLERGEGAIVNVASILSFAASLPPDPLPQRATYAATKGFVLTFTRTLAAEVAGTPVRVQVVCPGYTKTEFHMTTGADPVDGTAPDDQPEGAMLPEDVVQASLVGLELGEVVCVPGLADPSAMEGLIAAEEAMRGGNFAPLAERYRG